MLDEIPSRLLTEWMAFYGLEPFGFDVAMFGHAQTASTIFNMNRPKGERAREPRDFYPQLERKEDEGEEHKSADVFGMLKRVLMGGRSDK